MQAWLPRQSCSWGWSVAANEMHNAENYIHGLLLQQTFLITKQKYSDLLWLRKQKEWATHHKNRFALRSTLANLPKKSVTNSRIITEIAENCPGISKYGQFKNGPKWTEQIGYPPVRGGPSLFPQGHHAAANDRPGARPEHHLPAGDPWEKTQRMPFTWRSHVMVSIMIVRMFGFNGENAAQMGFKFRQWTRGATNAGFFSKHREPKKIGVKNPRGRITDRTTPPVPTKPTQETPKKICYREPSNWKKCIIEIHDSFSPLNSGLCRVLAAWKWYWLLIWTWSMQIDYTFFHEQMVENAIILLAWKRTNPDQKKDIRPFELTDHRKKIVYLK